MSKRKVTLDYSKGSGEGTAIYLNCTNEDGSGSGYRVAGGKCWGYISVERSFELSISDLEDIENEAKKAIKFLKKNSK